MKRKNTIEDAVLLNGWPHEKHIFFKAYYVSTFSLYIDNKKMHARFWLTSMLLLSKSTFSNPLLKCDFEPENAHFKHL
jgi:hypothetical protein